LEGLPSGVIPITPILHAFRKKIPGIGRDAACIRKIEQRQLPMTAAYAFTDYRAQGQTLPAVVVDIAKVPNGQLNLFNVYVALSRSAGRENIRLLRTYDHDVF
ncbi:hypothetical protein GGF50DRAFT_30633, partial [Schizophyllum commune]